MHNYEASDKARIPIAWNSTSITLHIMHKTSQLIHCCVGDKHTGDQWMCFFVVYGLQTVEDRRSLWMDHSNINKSIGDP